jgi:hypothetical protein
MYAGPTASSPSPASCPCSVSPRPRQGFASSYGRTAEKAVASTVKVNLSEWKVQLSPARIPAGPVTIEVKNGGTIPHAFEVEGPGLEKSTPQIQPGATATLTVNLRTGSYETYCPVGKGSHKMLGMMNHLLVGDAKASAAKDEDESGHEMAMDHTMTKDGDENEGVDKTMRVTGGGPVIEILPGPFPFADSAAVVIKNRPPDQQADLTHKAQMGPYSNNVATITGDISLVATDRGASGDSVSGVAQFTAKDGARWKLVMDRVQTKDIPFNPRFGGVIMGLFYHGASGVHTPLVPTIQSSLALWAFAHCTRTISSSRTTPWFTSCCSRALAEPATGRWIAGTAPTGPSRSCSCR